jgi:hypothetical protein
LLATLCCVACGDDTTSPGSAARSVRVAGEVDDVEFVHRVLEQRFEVLGLPKPSVDLERDGGEIGLRGSRSELAAGERLIARQGALHLRSIAGFDDASATYTWVDGVDEDLHPDRAIVVDDNESQGEFDVRVELSGTSRQRFDLMLFDCRARSRRCPTGEFAVLIDDEVLTAPFSNVDRLPQPYYDIGPYKRPHANELAATLSAGPLPALTPEPGLQPDETASL